MSSNIKINRVCNFCNKDFIAKTTVTKYCSHKCTSASYKKRAKEQGKDIADFLIQQDWRLFRK